MSFAVHEGEGCRQRLEEFVRTHRTGLVALVFTDMEDSTALKQKLEDVGAVGVMQAHHALLRQVLAGFPEAAEIGTAGDSFFLVFTKPSDAVRFALQTQAGLRGLAASLGTVVRDRMGIHIGEVAAEAGTGRDLYGLQVDTCARVMSLAAGGQVLLTRGVFDNARQVLKGEDLAGVGPVGWLNHGLYGVKGVEEALEICEVGEHGLAPLAAPGDTEKARRHTGQAGEPVLGWRPAVGQGVPGTGWELVRQLGEGGFGEVWLGRHKGLKEERVFKFCFRADRVRALRREVTIWRLLKERLGLHPNIVPVREVYLEEAPYYLVMDYAAGQDLGAWCARHGGAGAVPAGLKLEVVAQVAEALGAAHSAGVIHRDVKPGNILVEETGEGQVRARLTDFGIGEVLDKERATDVTLAGFTATLSGAEGLAGSQMYLAPEVWAGQPPGPAADVYSLGVVLYQLLAGNLKQPVTPDWEERITDPECRRILTSLVASNPADRPASCAEIARVLRAAEGENSRRKETLSRAAGWRLFAYRLLYLGGIGALGLGTLGLLWAWLSPVRDFPDTGLPAEALMFSLSLLGMGGAMVAGAIGRVSVVMLLVPLLIGLGLGPFAWARSAATGAWWPAALPACGLAYLGSLCFIASRVRARSHPCGAEQPVPLYPRVHWAWLALALGLAGLVYPVENFRGRRAWEKFAAGMQAKGLPMTAAAFAGPKVPDELNFCRAPGVPAIIYPVEPAATMRLAYYPADGAFPMPLAAMARAAEEERGRVVRPGTEELGLDSVPRDFSIRERQLDSALEQFLAGSKTRYRMDPRAAKKLGSGMHFSDHDFLYARANVRPATALAEFLGRHALRIEARDPDGVWVVGLRPGSPEAMLEWYRRWEPLFAALRNATDRPVAQPGVPVYFGSPADLMPNFSRVREICQNLMNHATASLLAGQSETAVRDMVAVFRIAAACGTHPTVVGGMIAIALHGLCGGAIEEWMGAGLLDTRALDQLDQELRQINLPGMLRTALAAECLNIHHAVVDHSIGGQLGNDFQVMTTFGVKPPPLPGKLALVVIAWLADLGPAGWKQQGSVSYGRFTDETYLARLVQRGERHIIQFGALAGNSEHHGNPLNPYTWSLSGSGRYLFGEIGGSAHVTWDWAPNYTRALELAARNQTLLDHGRIAIALRKCHDRSGTSPDSLEDLPVADVAKLPPDVMSGAPMKYRRLGKAGYLLYSVGWNGQDDGGQALKEQAAWDESKDWVWRGGPQN